MGRALRAHFLRNGAIAPGLERFATWRSTQGGSTICPLAESKLSSPGRAWFRQGITAGAASMEAIVTHCDSLTSMESIAERTMGPIVVEGGNS